MVKEDDMGDEEKMETKGKVLVIAFIESEAERIEKQAEEALEYGPGAVWFRYNRLEAKVLRELAAAVAALPDDDERFRRIGAAFAKLQEVSPELDKEALF